MTVSILVEWPGENPGDEDHFAEWWLDMYDATEWRVGEELVKWGGTFRSNFGCLYIDFEDEQMATLFLLRWA